MTRVARVFFCSRATLFLNRALFYSMQLCDKVAHSCDEIEWQNRRYDIGPIVSSAESRRNRQLRPNLVSSQSHVPSHFHKLLPTAIHFSMQDCILCCYLPRHFDQCVMLPINLSKCGIFFETRITDRVKTILNSRIGVVIWPTVYTHAAPVFIF